MPDQKISQLTAGGAAQATDLLPVARGATNVSLLAKDIATALERLAASGQSLTGTQATSLVDLAATWNTTGTPTAIKLNVTNTASNANSLLMDLQVGGASRFQVMVAGNTYANGGSKVIIGDTLQLTGTGGGSVADYAFVAAPASAIGSGILAAGQRYGFTSVYGLYVGTQPITWGANANVTAAVPDLYITRDAANTLAQCNSTNAQTFRLYNTFTDASNYERGKLEWASNVLRIGTEKAGTGTARALELQTDGTTRVTVPADGSSISVPNLILGVGSNITIRAASGAVNLESGGSSYAQFSAGGLYTSNLNLGNSENPRLLREAAGVLAQRSDTNAQTFRLYNTFTDVSNYERTAITTAAFGGVRYQQILAESAGTGAANLGIVLAPKGTGALSLQMPDGTTTGGNARGANAVDLTVGRSAADNVASGANSFQAAAANARASGQYSVAMNNGSVASGTSATALSGGNATGNNSFAAGFSSTASGSNSVVLSDSSTASGQSAVAIGYYATASGVRAIAMNHGSSATNLGEFAYGYRGNSTSGFGQYRSIGLSNATTTSSATELFAEGVSGFRMVIPANCTWAANLIIIARTRNGISNAAFERRCIIKRDGANSTTLVGSVQTIGTDIKTDTDLDLSVTITADDTNEALRVEVTGKMGGTVSTLTSSGTTCTLTSTANHGLSTGDYVTIAGANETAYNGTFVITRTGATTFTYTAATTPSATPATGTITANINCRWLAKVDCIEMGFAA